MSIDNTPSPTIDKKVYDKLHKDLMRAFEHAVSRATGYNNDASEYAKAAAQLSNAIINLERVKPK
jgi:hypothetical protein